MSNIHGVKAREIIDSRGNPTIEVFCKFASGIIGSASVPSGASTGSHEAFELRDHDAHRYHGMGVLTAVHNVNQGVNEFLKNKSFNQQTLDAALIELDGTPNKSRVGANAILGVSLAFARAKAIEEKRELYEYFGELVGATAFRLPEPMFNIINGGKHADSGLDIQEYMISPVGLETMKEKVRAASEIIVSLRKILELKGYPVGVGDEGGFAPKLSSNEEAFQCVLQAIGDAGYSEELVKIGIDAAATSFYAEGTYTLMAGGKRKELGSADLIAWYKKLVDTYGIVSIEDGLAEEDWNGFTALTHELGGRIQIVGDDLLVTNVHRIKKAAEHRAVNSVLIKPNQIGTVSETIVAVQATKEQGWSAFASHRSGETADTFIADLAVGLSCDFIKAGSLARGERVAKYNRLMEIEDMV